jgi:hypothetical protein
MTESKKVTVSQFQKIVKYVIDIPDYKKAHFTAYLITLELN